MKIAQVTEFFAPWTGGISEHVESLTRELMARGHEVHVVTGNLPKIPGRPLRPELEAFTRRVGPTISFPYNASLANVTYSWRLPRLLDELFEREAYDVIHTHNPMMPVLPLLALDRSPAVNVGTFHSFHSREHMIEMWKWVLSPRMRKLQLPIAVSSSAQRAYETYFEAPFEVVPNGIDLATFCPNGHVPAADGEQSLLFVGQMVPKKGLPVLLRAFELLLQEFPQLSLRIIGDGPLRRVYEGQLGGRARERTEWLGERHGDQLVQAYQCCDVFCAPSIGNESFGITLLEAMAAGKPIVAANIAGYSDVVRDGEEALLYDSEDAHHLRDVLRRLVTDASLRRSLADHGRRSVQRYAWPRIAALVETRYERLLAAC